MGGARALRFAERLRLSSTYSVAGGWTMAAFLKCARLAREEAGTAAKSRNLLKEDRFWAGLLCATAVFMLFYFI